MSVDSDELETNIQRAAERRLAYCHASAFEEDIPEELQDEQPLAPFCGCDTCIVREVIDAAWPFVMELARDEIRQEQA